MKEQILKIVQANPHLTAAVEHAAQQLSATASFTPEVQQKLIALFERVLQDPQSYPALLQTLKSQGMDVSFLPPEFSQTAIVVILGALYLLSPGEEQPQDAQGQMGMPQEAPAPQQQAFASGGLARLAAQGRNGDTQLAHINPFEASVLRSMGGSGTTNPRTGLREYGFFDEIGKGLSDLGKSLGPMLAAVAPMALDAFVPGAGSALGGMFGASGSWAPVLGNALIGGASSALGGGDFAKGAAIGGMGAGLGSMVGEGAGSAMGMELGKGATDALGSALVGGGMGALQGRGFGQGALTGALGSMVGSAASGLGGEGALNTGLRQAGATAGNMLTAGSSGQEALAGGALSGLLAGGRAYARPSDVATFGGAKSPVETTPKQPDAGSVISARGMLAATPALLTLLGGADTQEQVMQAAPGMSPEQREYFSRTLKPWDWDKLRNDASRAGMGLGQYMATNWNKLGTGSADYSQPTKLAQGGLSQLAQGGGSGRDDTIDARLSDGEYVMDAETVAMIGDGSTKAGAQRLDQMREQLRKHKGAALSRGKISPNAKSPLAYLKEAA